MAKNTGMEADSFGRDFALDRGLEHVDDVHSSILCAKRNFTLCHLFLMSYRRWRSQQRIQRGKCATEFAVVVAGMFFPSAWSFTLLRKRRLPFDIEARPNKVGDIIFKVEQRHEGRAKDESKSTHRDLSNFSGGVLLCRAGTRPGADARGARVQIAYGLWRSLAKN